MLQELLQSVDSEVPDSRRSVLGVALLLASVCLNQTVIAGSTVDMNYIGVKGTGASTGYAGLEIELKLDSVPPQITATRCQTMATAVYTDLVSTLFPTVVGTSKSATIPVGQNSVRGANVLLSPQFYVPNPLKIGHWNNAMLTESGKICAIGADDQLGGRMFSEVQGELMTGRFITCSGGVGNVECTESNKGSMGGSLSMRDRTDSFVVEAAYEKQTLICLGEPNCMYAALTAQNHGSATLGCQGWLTNPALQTVEFAARSDSNILGEIVLNPGDKRTISFQSPIPYFYGISDLDNPGHLVTGPSFWVGCRPLCAVGSGTCLYQALEAAAGGSGTAINSRSTEQVLTVMKVGNGFGTVSSTPAGINCGSVCSALFEVNSSIALTAAPSNGSTFAGWSGDCEGNAATIAT